MPFQLWRFEIWTGCTSNVRTLSRWSSLAVRLPPQRERVTKMVNNILEVDLRLANDCKRKHTYCSQNAGTSRTALHCLVSISWRRGYRIIFTETSLSLHDSYTTWHSTAPASWPNLVDEIWGYPSSYTSGILEIAVKASTDTGSIQSR